jgi:hypothetical protein
MTKNRRALAVGATLVMLAAPTAAQDSTACPPGTAPGSAPGSTPDALGREQWCERPGPPKTSHGPYVRYHASGAARVRGEYANGAPSGAWRSWHPDGTPSGEVTFTDGKPTGMLLGWYANGKASFVGGFRDGTAIGVTEIFDRDGRLRLSVDYGPDGSGRRRSAWDDANRPIDPASPDALAIRDAAVQSSLLIDMALMASSAAR